MAQGLDVEHLVIRWQWRPVPPPPMDRALAGAALRDDGAFRAVTLPEAEAKAYGFSFPQLARLTPDLHFYRLLQLFNTPLLSVSSREAGHHAYALWRGQMPEVFRTDSRWAHLWFFRDELDGDELALEYGFAGGFTLRSTQKSAAVRRERYLAICERLNRQ